MSAMTALSPAATPVATTAMPAGNAMPGVAGEPAVTAVSAEPVAETVAPQGIALEAPPAV